MLLLRILGWSKFCPGRASKWFGFYRFQIFILGSKFWLFFYCFLLLFMFKIIFIDVRDHVTNYWSDGLTNLKSDFSKLSASQAPTDKIDKTVSLLQETKILLQKENRLYLRHGTRIKKSGEITKSTKFTPVLLLSGSLSWLKKNLLEFD